MTPIPNERFYAFVIHIANTLAQINAMRNWIADCGWDVIALRSLSQLLQYNSRIFMQSSSSNSQRITFVAFFSLFWFSCSLQRTTSFENAPKVLKTLKPRVKKKVLESQTFVNFATMQMVAMEQLNMVLH